MLSHKSVRDVAYRVRWLNQGGRPGGREKVARSGAEAAGRVRASGSRGGGAGAGAAPRGKARPLAGGSAALPRYSMLGGGPVGGCGTDLMAGGGLQRGGGGLSGDAFLLSGFDFPPLPGRAPGVALRGASVGTTEELLHANGQLVELIGARLSAGQAQESRQLLISLRENLVTVIHRMETAEGVMAQMPPLPVQPNLDLAERLLGPRHTDTPWH